MLISQVLHTLITYKLKMRLELVKNKQYLSKSHLRKVKDKIVKLRFLKKMKMNMMGKVTYYYIEMKIRNYKHQSEEIVIMS